MFLPNQRAFILGRALFHVRNQCPNPHPYLRVDCKDPSLQGGDGDVAPAKGSLGNRQSQCSGERWGWVSLTYDGGYQPLSAAKRDDGDG